LCGTRGWFYEEEKGNAHDKKLLAREVLRLKASLDAAGDRKKLVFLHYPPITRNYRCEEILALLRDYEVRLCLYGHLHAKSHAIAWNGWYNGTDFHLVSADFLNFKPLNIDGYLYS
jgi:predicted phosphohydrolase